MEARGTAEAGRANGSGQAAWLPNPPVETLPRDPRIDLYLRDVCEPLLLTAPPKRVRELRAELAEHLESLVAARMELGDDANAAVEAALRQFGDAEQLASQWVRQYRGRQPAVGFKEFLKVCAFTGAMGLGSFILSYYDAHMQRTPTEHMLAWPFLMLVVGGVWGPRLRRPDAAWGLLVIATVSLAISHLVSHQTFYGAEAPSLYGAIIHLIGSFLAAPGAAGLVGWFVNRRAARNTVSTIRLA